MSSKFFPGYSLAELIESQIFALPETNWLFVTIDSNPNVEKLALYLASSLEKERVKFRATPAGLWLPSSELSNPFVKSKVVVPFSGCYIFGSDTQTPPRPSFKITTDTGSEFTPNLKAEVTREVKRLNALCYAADGCGCSA